VLALNPEEEDTGPYRAPTGPEMTDYFASTTVTCTGTWECNGCSVAEGCEID